MPVGDLLSLRAVHADEIGDGVSPDLHGVHCSSGRGRVEDGLDGLPVIEDDHAVSIGHGGGYFLRIELSLLPPVSGGGLRIDVGLATGDVCAHVGIGMSLHSAAHLGDRIGSCGGSLGL